MTALLRETAFMATLKAEETHLSNLHHSVTLKERLCIALDFAHAGSPHVAIFQQMSFIDA